jgi:hypothetical protein
MGVHVIQIPLTWLSPISSFCVCLSVCLVVSLPYSLFCLISPFVWLYLSPYRLGFLISHLPMILLFGLVFPICFILFYVGLIGLFRLVQFHLVLFGLPSCGSVWFGESTLIVCLWSTIYGVSFDCLVSHNSAHNWLVWFRSVHLVWIEYDWFALLLPLMVRCFCCFLFGCFALLVMILVGSAFRVNFVTSLKLNKLLAWGVVLE